MAGQAEIDEGVFTVRMNNGAGRIVAVVSVKRPAANLNPAPQPPYCREYWDIVEVIGGTEANYEEFDHTVLQGGGTQTLYWTKVSGWPWNADAHPPFPVVTNVPAPATGTRLRRWYVSGVSIGTHTA